MFRLLFKSASIPLFFGGYFMSKYLIQKQNYKIARSYHCHYDIRIDDDKDIEHVKLDMNHIQKVDNLHISVRDNILTKEHFLELFSILSQSNQKRVHLDLTNTDIDEEKLEALTNCLKNWDLNYLQLHVNRIKFTDEQFQKLLNTLENMTGLHSLILEMEDVNLGVSKRKMIEDTLDHMKHLKSVHINLRNNEISQEDARSIRKMLDKFDMSHLFF
jgi:hypothetical protein